MALQVKLWLDGRVFSCHCRPLFTFSCPANGWATRVYLNNVYSSQNHFSAHVIRLDQPHSELHISCASKDSTSHLLILRDARFSATIEGENNLLIVIST